MLGKDRPPAYVSVVNDTASPAVSGEAHGEPVLDQIVGGVGARSWVNAS